MATCSPAVSDPLAATVDDFITAYTMVEAVELSNLDSGGSSINCDRLNLALADAYRELQGAKLMLDPTGKMVVDTNLRRWMLILARYFLDTVRRREDVTQDYQTIMDKLKNLADPSADQSAFGVFRVYNNNGKTPVWTQESLSDVNKRTFGIL